MIRSASGPASLIALALAAAGCSRPPSDPPERAPAWGAAAVSIEADDAGDARSPDLAVDAAGRVYAVWPQSDGTRATVRWNRFTPGAGWGTAGAVETHASGDSSTASVTVHGDGNAFVVWERSDGGNTVPHVWSTQLFNGAWETPVQLDTGTLGASLATLADDPNGDVIVTWQQWMDTAAGTQNHIWSARYVGGRGWNQAPAQVESNTAGQALLPSVSSDASGNAIAVWMQAEPVNQWHAWGSRYVPGTGWSTPVRLETSAGKAQAPKVGMDRSGNAVVIWGSTIQTTTSLWASRYAGGQWSAPVLLETSDAGTVVSFDVAVAADGTAVAVWRQAEGSRYGVYANVYRPGTGWEGAAVLSAADVGSDANLLTGPKAAVAEGGAAAAVWDAWDGTRASIWATYRAVGKPWGAPVRLDGDAGNASAPALVMDENGRATAAWMQAGAAGRLSIWAARTE